MEMILLGAGEFQMALYELRQAGKGEVAEALEATAVRLNVPGIRDILQASGLPRDFLDAHAGQLDSVPEQQESRCIRPETPALAPHVTADQGAVEYKYESAGDWPTRRY